MQKFPWELFLQSTGALSGGTKDVILICKTKRRKLSLSFNILPGKPRSSMGKPKHFRIVRKLRGCIVQGVGVGCKARWELQGDLAGWPSSPWLPTYLKEANGLLVPQMGGQGKERKFYRCSKCPKVRRQLTLVDAIVLSCHKVATSKATCFSIKCFWCSILCPKAYENQVHGGFLWYSNKKVGFPQCKYEKESSLLLSTT